MEGRMTILWEYLRIRLKPVDADALFELNRLGALGWELVAVSYSEAYFKRPLVWLAEDWKGV